MTNINMKEFSLPGFVRRYPTLIVGLLLTLIIIAQSVFNGSFGQIGPDNDDVMRLIQIRDFLGLGPLEKQSWFDTNQYRLGPENGTDMHWSRLADIPIILLTLIFDLFTTRETALRWAYSIWPPFSVLLFILAMAKGAKYWAVVNQSVSRPVINKDKTHFFTLVLLAFFSFNFYRFSPGAIDHHNIQIILIVLSIAFALDPESKFFTFGFSGFAAAISIAIGVEVAFFIAIICSFMALNWLIRGEHVARGTQGFGAGLTFGLFLSFFGTISPAEYGIISCDALSLITLVAGSAGGLGLILAVHYGGKNGMIGRVLSLSTLGLVCCLILSLQAPQCLSNPLSTLPDVVERLWLNQIIEARPISLSMKDAAAQIPFMIGPPLFAVCILCWDIWKRRKWTAHILLLLLLLGALSLAIHQVRFQPFAYIFSILPLAGFISRLYVRNTHKASANDKNSNSPNLLYIGALALSIPIMWAMPGLLFIKKSSVNSSKQITACYSDKVMKSLNSLPVGLIAATSNGSASILQFTEHRALSGNYHRNVEGISTQIKIATSETDKAIDLLKKYNVNYVHFCYPSNESKNLINENEKGFYSDLKAGKVPSGLELAVPKIENAVEISIYRVIE